MKMAHEVVVDHVKHEIRIDDLVFPYHVEENPEVEVIDGVLGVLRVGILADNLSIITDDGTRTMLRAPQSVELAWAKRRAQEIVRDGLADVLAWLAPTARAGGA